MYVQISILYIFYKGTRWACLGASSTPLLTIDCVHVLQVHAAPNRFHAAYLGACSVASMPQFKGMAISRDEWRREGARSFKKWQTAAS